MLHTGSLNILYSDISQDKQKDCDLNFKPTIFYVILYSNRYVDATIWQKIRYAVWLLYI